MAEGPTVLESSNDGNRHVFVQDETTDNVWHWWQNMAGKPSYAWNCEELKANPT